MKFKYEQKSHEFWSLKPKLRLILCDLEYFCLNEFGKELIITELLRKPRSDNDVHPYGRGADIRSWIFDDKEKLDIIEYINRKYPYGDGEHDSIIFHDVGKGEHFHIQVIYKS